MAAVGQAQIVQCSLFFRYRPVPLELILMIMTNRNFKSENRMTDEELNARAKELAERNAGYREKFSSVLP